MTLTLTLDPAIRHTIVHNSLTSTYIPNFIQIEETLWTDGRTYGHTDVQTDGHFPPLILIGRLLEVDLKTLLYISYRYNSNRFSSKLVTANGFKAEAVGLLR